jgi:(1->4)-alpha-D-glucan 1-alpha-D-glucosylmutase
VAERQREKEVARERLLRLVAESPAISTHIDGCVRTMNGTPGERSSFDLLHDLLEHQAYRLAYWRTAVDEINYRRFFDVNELAGLRTERPEVFEDTHRLLAQMIADGQVTGVRVDHPDGLFDPGEYFTRLQQLSRAARASADSVDGSAPLYVVAEKILSRGETLRPDWEVMGTTGYGFLNLVAGLFVDGRNTGRLRRIYGQVTGSQKPFEEVAYASKVTIMQTAMASELNVLAHALNRLSERDRRLRDFTLNNCRRLLREVIACFQVYRTYVGPRGASEFDRSAVDVGIGEARRRNPLMEVSIFEFLRDTLLPAGSSATWSAERLRFAMRFQQVTGPVQAKGVEDTAFYRYNVLISANDVGGHPGRLDVPPGEFHDANAARRECWPLEMVTTATHDTKRGEDARLRIAAISEVPSAWRSAVSEWMRINGRHRASVTAGAWAPDRNDEYLFYQTLVGVWPAERLDAPVPDRAEADLVDRVTAYMQKAVREAKVHTSWIDQNEAYGRAVARFIDQVLTGRNAGRFLRSFVPFQRRVARIAMHHGLSQVTLKIASPGVPDFYQGGELWDFNLVDPDNRRPVDFDRRRALLAQLRPLLESIDTGSATADRLHDLLLHLEDARAKLFVTAAGLRARRARSEVFLDGGYVALPVTGPAADHVVAFARVHASGTVLTAVPRLVGALLAPGSAMLDPMVWQGTQLTLPDSVPGSAFRHMFTGARVEPSRTDGRATLDLQDLLQHWPVALLSSQP